MTNYQDHDKPVLSRLVDIRIAPPSSAAPPPTTSSSLGFSLEFHFAENEFFSNRTLTKEYDVRCEPDAAEPFADHSLASAQGPLPTSSGTFGYRSHWQILIVNNGEV